MYYFLVSFIGLLAFNVITLSPALTQLTHVFDLQNQALVLESTEESLENLAGAGDIPNVLIILADDMAYRDVCAFGNNTYCENNVTPVLDELTAESLKFTHAYANAPVCSPTRAAMLTGQHPSRFSFRHTCGRTAQLGIPEHVLTLPQMLGGSGYTTHHIGKWHLSGALSIDDDHTYAPNGIGYDEFFGFIGAVHTNGGYAAPGGTSPTYIDPYLRENEGDYTQYSGHLTDILGDKVVETITNATEPFFITYWPYAPHSPIELDEPYVGKFPDISNNADYAALVNKLDFNVGKILSALETRGIADNTIVIFLSDNGGTKADHTGGIEGLRGFKHFVWEGGIKVPMAIRWPGHVPANTESDEIVLTYDIFPTLADILGINIENNLIDGISFESLLSNPNATLPDRNLFWEYNRTNNGIFRFAVRNPDGYKLVSDDGNISLYNVVSDPGEKTDLSGSNQSLVNELMSTYNDWKWETSVIEEEVVGLFGSTTEAKPGLYRFFSNDGLLRIAHRSTQNPDIFDFSFAAWIKPVKPTADQVIATKGNGAWRLSYTKNKNVRLHVTPKKGSGKSLTTTEKLVPNQWNHVAFTMAQGQEQKIYINGIEAASADYKQARANTQDVGIGNVLKNTNGRGFIGRIFEPTLYNRELTPDEIADFAADTPNFN